MTARWLDQVQSLARDALPEPVFRYVEQGARDEVTLGEASEAWRSIRLAPHVLRDVREVDTSCTLLGDSFRLPVGVAPMTLQRAAHPDGEIAMARAAAAAGDREIAADVVQHQLRLRRRFEIGKAQRRSALLQIRNEMQHHRRTRRISSSLPRICRRSPRR